METKIFFILFIAIGSFAIVRSTQLADSDFDNQIFEAIKIRLAEQEKAKQDFFAKENCSTFDNFPSTKAFVCNQSEGFLFELLGDDRKIYVKDFVERFWNLTFDGVSASDKDEFLLAIMKLLVNQTITNPPQYVSHGTDHSVRVMEWAVQLDVVGDLAKGMEDQYDTDAEQSKFILGLLGILHDIGYADIDQHKVPKWLHSISSGMMVDDLLQQSDGLGEKILKSSGKKTDSLVNDFIVAIGTHNFDDGFCKWNVSNPLYKKECSFTCHGDPNDPTSATTPILNRTEPYYRGYTLGYADSTPLTFAVRIADNLDAIRTRLTPVQNDPKLMRFFLRIYQNQDLREAAASDADDLSEQKEKARKIAAEATGLTNATKEQRSVMDRSDEQSWLHFYSNWLIDSSIIDPVTWTIRVEFFNLTGDLSFEYHPGPGLYQMNRFASSALSCYVNKDTSFLELVRLNFNLPIQGLDGGSYIPLKAFTKKPIYQSNGQSKWSDGQEEQICDPYCERLTKSLTLSPEPCLTTDGKPTTDCPFEGFSKVPPFTDLTYPTNVLELSQPKGKKKGLSGTGLGLIIGGVALFVIIVVVVVIVAVVRRRKAGYVEIPTK